MGRLWSKQVLVSSKISDEVYGSKARKNLRKKSQKFWKKDKLVGRSVAHLHEYVLIPLFLI